MAYTDFDDEEARQAALLGAGGVSGAAPAPTGAPAAQGPQAGSQSAPGGPGTGFVNFNQLLGLNAAGGQQMADAITGDLSGRANAVTQGAASLNSAAHNAGATGEAHRPQQAAQLQQDASDVAARGRSLQQMGPGQALSDLYGGRPYSSGENAMDAALAGGVAGGTLRGAGARFSTFGGLLGLDSQPVAPSGDSAAEDDRGAGNGGSGGGGRGMPIGPGGGGLLDDAEERRRRARQQRVETRSNPNPFGGLLGGG